MEKTQLRNKLFNKYFEIEEGIPVIDLTGKLDFISEVWKKLRLLCMTNIRHFHPYNPIYSCKIVEHNKKKYFILKIGFWEYCIIDIEKKENITIEQFKNDFNENFFVNNFDEQRDECENIYSSSYRITKYTGDIEELLKFYIENQNVLSLTSEIYYEFKIENAVTNFRIDFMNANAVMSFETPDQFLYEHLFLKYDLTPSPMQDAHDKIGIERMKEMFSVIQNIKIPFEFIPDDLYQQYLIQSNKEKILKKNN